MDAVETSNPMQIAFGTIESLNPLFHYQQNLIHTYI
ncbi:DUF2577 domain-containing protein [Clostridioides difficile]|nr:DUF2577 domain-containing protein [Clostridioides difficile]MCE0775437.1 DUF2577 domain-containing protein [Clostridioides difficile]